MIKEVGENTLVKWVSLSLILLRFWLLTLLLAVNTWGLGNEAASTLYLIRLGLSSLASLPYIFLLGFLVLHEISFLPYLHQEATTISH